MIISFHTSHGEHFVHSVGSRRHSSPDQKVMLHHVYCGRRLRHLTRKKSGNERAGRGGGGGERGEGEAKKAMGVVWVGHSVK